MLIATTLEDSGFRCLLRQWRRPPRYLRGFTLIEIQVGMLLLALILTLLFGALHLTSHSWRGAEQRIDRAEERRLATMFLRRMVSQAVPLVEVRDRKRAVVFHGDERSLRFAAMLPAHLSGGGIYLISVDVLNGTEGVEMRFSYDPIGTDASAQLGSQGPPADSVRLVRNAQDARFAYYGRKSGADVTRWHTSWEDPQALPRLVRLTLVFADTQVPWPDMVFPIRVEPGVGTAHLTLRDASGQEALPGDEELTETPIEGESEDEPAPEE